MTRPARAPLLAYSENRARMVSPYARLSPAWTSVRCADTHADGVAPAGVSVNGPSGRPLGISAPFTVAEATLNGTRTT